MYGLLSDSHLHNWSAFSHVNEKGINNRLQHILDEFWSCASALHKAGGDTMYHGGDLFHERGKIAPSVLNPFVEALWAIHHEFGTKFVFMPGNHDMEFNDTQSVGYSMNSLQDETNGIYICKEPQYFKADKVLMIPWFDSLDDLRRVVGEWTAKLGPTISSKADLIIHAPLNGVITGIPDHGLEAREVAAWGFSRVFCGHYHRRMSFESSKVWSIGATTHQTFSDIGTEAGFMLLGGDDNAVHMINAKAPQFVAYDLVWNERQAFAHCKGNYVRVRLEDATEDEIRAVRDGLSEMGAAAVTIEATRQVRIVAREHTAVESGQSLKQSLTAFVNADDSVTLKDEVLKESMAILGQLEEIAA